MTVGKFIKVRKTIKNPDEAIIYISDTAAGTRDIDEIIKTLDFAVYYIHTKKPKHKK